MTTEVIIIIAVGMFISNFIGFHFGFKVGEKKNKQDKTND